MRDWNTRILLFSKEENDNRYLDNKSLIVRRGKFHTEFDLRFNSIEEGLEYVSSKGEIEELCTFRQGERLPLNNSVEMRSGINYGFYSMDEEKYWLAHEIFEDFWKHYEGDRSTFFHNVVLLCVSMVHFQMNHEPIAIRLFGEARNGLTHFIEEAKSWKFSYPLDNGILNQLRERAMILADV
ncbi:MAG: DUF309 domain-containing protein [Thermoplasmata archaeon]